MHLLNNVTGYIADLAVTPAVTDTRARLHHPG